MVFYRILITCYSHSRWGKCIPKRWIWWWCSVL